MEPSTTNEVTNDFSPFFRVYKDGRIERSRVPEFAPPTDDPETAVRSKDVIVSPETGVSARLYVPKINDPGRRLPLLIYIHGGGFCLGSASSPKFHDFIRSLVAEAKAVAVSVDYRLAPEHLLPTAYDDAWDVFRWVVYHSGGKGPDPWLNDHADFDRVYLCGDSAGANIANDVAIRAGSKGPDLGGAKLLGLLLVHPFFGGKEIDKMYKFMCPSSTGRDDDPRLNPAVDPRLPAMGCERVLFCLAEKDWQRERGWAYYEALQKSGWVGEVEMTETEGVGHGFHLFDPTCEKAVTQLKRLASFVI